MIVAVIILSIALIVSVVFNIMLSSSKNSAASLMKKINKENRDIKAENNDLQGTVAQLQSKIKSYEETIRGYSDQKDQAYNLQIELEEHKKANSELSVKNENLRKQLDSESDNFKIIFEQKKQITDLENENKRLAARMKELENTVQIPIIPDGRTSELEKIITNQEKTIEDLNVHLESKSEEIRTFKQDYELVSKKYAELQRILEQLKIQNTGYQAQIINAKKQSVDLNAKISTLLAEKAELEKKNAQLIEQNQKKADTNEAILASIAQVKSDNEVLKVDIDDYKNQLVLKQIRITELESENFMLQKQIGAGYILGDKSDKEPSKEPDFPIDSEVILFKDGKYDDTLKLLSDISAITAYLKNSTHEKAQRYLNYVKAYTDEVDDLVEAFARLDADEDELSAECISKFSKVFNEYMAENIIEPIFKAKDEDKFYSELLETIIKYVANCGIYTKKVIVGNKFENINFMEVITEDTADAIQHKTISRILRLPFYAKYTSETGKVKEKLLSKGSCVVLKAK